VITALVVFLIAALLGLSVFVLTAEAFTEADARIDRLLAEFDRDHPRAVDE